MSYQQIQHDQDKAARKAAKEGEYPYSPEWHELNDHRWVKEIPFIGDYVPAGWELLESHTVDSSGFGREDEPALTIDRFVGDCRDRFKSGRQYGYAVITAGQFQVFVGVYTKTAMNKKGRRDPRLTETREGWTV